MSGQVKEASVQYLVGCHSCDSVDSVESRGELPGYKQTEIGVIPVNWKVDILEKMSAFITKGSTPTTYGFSWEKDGVLFLRSECVSERGLDLSESMYVSEKAHRVLKRSEVRSGDILITITGNVGRSICLDEKVVEGNINQHIARVRIISENINSTYVFHYLSQKAVRKYFQSITTGQAYPQISLTQVRNTEIPYPSLKEQTAIAKALSDVDSLITSLEKLITKKRAIKTAAMQQLLTGKKRLPPFDKTGDGKTKQFKKSKFGLIPEDWTVKTLKTISTMYGRIGWQGLKQEEFTFNDRQPFLITGMNFKDGKIRWNEVYHIAEDRYELDRNIQLRNGDILMTKDGTIGKLLYVDDIPAPHKASLNSHLLVFRPLQNTYEPKYLYYLMKTEMFSGHIDLHKSGSTFFGITQEAVGKFDCLLPDKKEQEAIAEVLYDMDNDIELLEVRLNKTQQLKQGMMQELLTGRTRLV